MSPATSAVVAAAADLHQGIGAGFAVAFAPDESRVAHMRKITTAHLRLWQVPEPTADDVVLAVSELVTNAIQHGDGAIALKAICSEGRLQVEVTDGSPNPAQLNSADDDALSGRGLFLIDALADNWGVSGDGTTTWATFRFLAGRP
ncbi:ATP-binding protein [Streptomyces sp. NPDC056486]|uniref:ATP-binding protein n=1 Tax=Streptomyces sp. NPDC056486 TaxID=3345835 RepID=UPI003680E917